MFFAEISRSFLPTSDYYGYSEHTSIHRNPWYVVHDYMYFFSYYVLFSHCWGFEGACIAGLFAGTVSHFMSGCPSWRQPMMFMSRLEPSTFRSKVWFAISTPRQVLPLYSRKIEGWRYQTKFDTWKSVSSSKMVLKWESVEMRRGTGSARELSIGPGFSGRVGFGLSNFRDAILHLFYPRSIISQES